MLRISPDGAAWRKKNHTPFFWSLTAFFLLFLLTTGMGYDYYAALNDMMTQQVFSQRTTVAGLSASAVKTKLDQLVNLAERFAEEPAIKMAVRVGNWAGALSAVKNLLDDPNFYDFYVDRMIFEDVHGRVRGAFPQLSENSIGKADILFNDWQKPILEDREKSFVSNVYKRDVSPRINLIKIIVPVRDSSRITGIFALTIPINSFSDFGKDINLSSDGFAYFVDRIGQIVTHPKFSSDGPIKDYSKAPAVGRLLSGSVGADVLYDPIDLRMRVVAYGRVPVYGWGVVAQEPVRQAFAWRDAMLRRVSLAIILLGLIDFFIAVLFFLIIKKTAQPTQ